MCEHNHVIVLDRFTKSRWEEAATPEEVAEFVADGGDAKPSEGVGTGYYVTNAD